MVNNKQQHKEITNNKKDVTRKIKYVTYILWLKIFVKKSQDTPWGLCFMARSNKLQK
jgi:hypothetical protein